MWHTLALALGGRTVAELQAHMSAAEFERWCDYYRIAPFDDRHRYHRPAALIASRNSRSPVEDLIDWLQPPDMPTEDLSVFKALGVRPRGFS